MSYHQEKMEIHSKVLMIVKNQFQFIGIFGLKNFSSF